MAKHHEDHPEYGEMGIFAGYGETETAMTDRTPGPWMIDEDYPECVTDSTGYEIAECNHSDDAIAKADAAAIVRWENHFDDLVAALEQIETVCTDNAPASCNQAMALDFVRQVARALLAKVKT